MDDLQLKQLLESQEIPAPNDNRRKEALNLAVAEFEKNQKNAKTSQGSSFLSRLIFRQPTDGREPMSFSKKKIIYGGLATACVALLVYGIAPTTMNSVSQFQDGASVDLSPQKAQTANVILPQAVEEQREEGKVGALVTDQAMSNVAPSPLDKVARVFEKKEKADVAMSAEADASSEVALKQMAAPAEAERVRAMVAPVSPPAQPTASVPSGIVDNKIGGYFPEPSIVDRAEIGRDKFKDFEQNAIKQVAQEPVSTFSIDVDTSSYSFMRQSLDGGVLPQVDAIRIEEMINYFDYAYPLPQSREEPFKASVAIKASPWNPARKLMTIGIKGFEAQKATQPDSNLVFLLDVSGSMDEPNKLPLLKQSLSMLIDSLKPTDKVSIVVYAGAAGMVLPPTEVANKNTILMALQNLQAGGSTAGAEGIRLAYQLAESNFNKNAVNRVILATDGDFNVGITNPEELQDFISRKRESGVFLSVLGFGTGNYNDDMMQRLAQNGNGVAAYIDTLNEARKVLVQEASATLFPIAKDVKIQVEFNPAMVSEYRLVGYETRALQTEDFNNDKVDAGDIGAGAEVTAIYEFTPLGAPKAVDDSRYAAPKGKAELPNDGEYAFLKLRYKLPDQNTSRLLTTPVTAAMENLDPIVTRETDWAVAVASFGQMLKGGKYSGSMTYDDILKLAQSSKGDDPFGYRAEFINLIYKAKTAAGLPSQGGQPYQQPLDGVVPVYPQPMPVPQLR